MCYIIFKMKSDVIRESCIVMNSMFRKQREDGEVYITKSFIIFIQILFWWHNQLESEMREMQHS